MFMIKLFCSLIIMIPVLIVSVITIANADIDWSFIDSLEWEDELTWPLI